MIILVQLTDGLTHSNYNIYYNNVGTFAYLSGTTDNAENIPYNTMINGVYVDVPSSGVTILIESTLPYCNYTFETCVRPECCVTPTPTPTPTLTPTPTPTPTPVIPLTDCVECYDEYVSGTTTDCNSVMYPYDTSRVCCTYIDEFGNPKAAPNDVIVNQTLFYNGCGGSGNVYFDVTIPSGSVSGCTTYTSQFTDECPPYGCVTNYTSWSSFTIPTGLCEGCHTGVTINVTDTGWIRYDDCEGNIIDTFINTLGTYTINDCIKCDTIRPAFPLADLANWNNVVCTTPCT